MNLFKTSFYTSVVTAVKLFCNFIIAKMLAVYAGPIGFALVGQFMNFMQVMQTFAGNMFGPGIVKYIAENKASPEEINKIISFGIILNIVLSIIVSCFIYFFRIWLSSLIFHNIQYAWVFCLTAVGTTFFVLNTFATSVLNGEGKIRLYSVVILLNNIFSVIFSASFIYFYGVSGALIAIAVNQSVVFFITFFLLRKGYCFNLTLCKQGFKYFKGLSDFGLMVIVSSLMLPIVQLLIRDYLAKKLSWGEVGIWQGMIKISDAYLVFFTSILSVYFLPKFSSLKDKVLIKKEIIKAYMHFLPVHLFVIAGVYLFRKEIILILYSKKFLEISNILLYQLIGDVFKILAWVVGYLMWAKKMTKLLISTEIIFSISYYLILVGFVRYFGITGTSLAFMLNYIIYFFSLYFLIYRRL